MTRRGRRPEGQLDLFSVTTPKRRTAPVMPAVEKDHMLATASWYELVEIYLDDIVDLLVAGDVNVIDIWTVEDEAPCRVNGGLAIQADPDEPVPWHVLWSDEDGWTAGPARSEEDARRRGPARATAQRMWIDYMGRALLPTAGHVVAWIRREVFEGYAGGRTQPPRFRRAGTKDDFDAQLRAAAARAMARAKTTTSPVAAPIATTDEKGQDDD